MADWEVIYKATADFTELREASAAARDDLKRTQAAVKEESDAEIRGATLAAAANAKDTEEIRKRTEAMERAIAVARAYEAATKGGPGGSGGDSIEKRLSDLGRETSATQLLERARQRGYATPQEDYSARERSIQQARLFNQASWGGYTTKDQYLQSLARERTELEALNTTWARRAQIIQSNAEAATRHANATASTTLSTGQVAAGGATQRAQAAVTRADQDLASRIAAARQQIAGLRSEITGLRISPAATGADDVLAQAEKIRKSISAIGDDYEKLGLRPTGLGRLNSEFDSVKAYASRSLKGIESEGDEAAHGLVASFRSAGTAFSDVWARFSTGARGALQDSSELESGFTRVVRAVSAGLQGAAGNGGVMSFITQLGTAFSGFGEGAAAAISPLTAGIAALVQFLPALAAGLGAVVTVAAALPTLLTAAAGAVGVFLSAIEPVIQVLGAYAKYLDAVNVAQSSSVAAMQQQAQVAHQLADAQFALQQAVVQGANSQVTAQHSVLDAEFSLRQARFNAAQEALQNAHAVADAQFALSQAYKSAALQQMQSQLSVASGYHSLTDAQFAVTQAQFTLNQTWIQAQRSLQDLQIQVSEAGLNIRGAQLNLEQAQQQYAQTMASATSTALDRAQAAYQIQQAEFALRQVELTNTRNEQDLATVRKYGASQVYGVTQAQHALVDAQFSEISAQKQLIITQKQAANAQITAAHQITDAVFALSQAQVSQKEGAITAAQAIIDAQFGVTQAQFSASQAAVTSAHQISDAQYQVAQAAYTAQFGTEAAASAWQQFQDLVAGNINAPAAVRFIEQMKPVLRFWNNLSVTQENFFRYLDTAIPSTARQWMPLENAVTGFLGTTATALGKSAAAIASWLQQFVESPAFKTILTPATGQIIETLAGAALDFARAFGQIAIAAAPFAEWLSGRFLSMAQRFLDWVNDSVASGGGFVKWLTDSEPILKSLGDLISSLVTWFGKLAEQGLPQAVPLFEALARQVLPLLFQILMALARPELLNALIQLIIAVEKLLLAVARGPLLHAFLDTLTLIAKVLADIASNKLAAPVLDALGAALGGLVAIRVLSGLARVVGLMKDIYTWGRAAAAAIGVFQSGGSFADALAAFSAFKAKNVATTAEGAAAAAGAAGATAATEAGLASSEAGLVAGETGIAGAGAASAAAIGGIGAAAGVAGVLIAGLAYSIYGLVKAYHDTLPPIKATVGGFREYISAAREAHSVSGTSWVSNVERGFGAAGKIVVTNLGVIQQAFGLTQHQAEVLSVKAGVSAQNLAATGQAGANAVQKVLTFGNAMSTASDQTNALEVKLTPVLSSLSSLSSTVIQSSLDVLSFEQAQQQAETQLAQTSFQITGNTQAAENNRQTVLSLTQQAIALANQQITVQGNVRAASRTLADQITFLQKAEGHTHAFTKEIQALQAQEAQLKGIIRTQIDVSGQGKWDVRLPQNLFRNLSALPQNLFQNLGFGTGGYLSADYGGTPGTDSVPALLMPGEYVQRQSAVAQYGVDAMEAVNTGRAVISYAAGGAVGPRRFADGGVAFAGGTGAPYAVTGDYSNGAGGLSQWMSRAVLGTTAAFGHAAAGQSAFGALGALGIFGGLTGARGYANPLRRVSGLTPERIDMGVDYAGFGPVYALGPGIITEADHAWIGAVGAPFPGTFITEKLTSGPLAGRFVYVAEDITLGVRAGQAVDSGTVIGVMAGGIETGFAAYPSGGVTAAAAAGQASSSGDPGANETAYGAEYSAILASLGAPAGIGHGIIVGAAPGGGSTLGSGKTVPHMAEGGPVADAIRSVARGQDPAQRAARYGMALGSQLWTGQDPRYIDRPRYGAFAIDTDAWHQISPGSALSPSLAASFAFPWYAHFAQAAALLDSPEQAAEIVAGQAQDLLARQHRSFGEGATEEAWDRVIAEFGPDRAHERRRHHRPRTVYGKSVSTEGPWGQASDRLDRAQRRLAEAVDAIQDARRGAGWHEWRKRHGKHKGEIMGRPPGLHRVRAELGRLYGDERADFGALRMDSAGRVTVLPGDIRRFAGSLGRLQGFLAPSRGSELERLLPGDTIRAWDAGAELYRAFDAARQLWEHRIDPGGGTLEPIQQWDQWSHLLAQQGRAEDRFFDPIEHASTSVASPHRRHHHKKHKGDPDYRQDKLEHRLRLARAVFIRAQKTLTAALRRLLGHRSADEIREDDFADLFSASRHLEDISGIIRERHRGGTTAAPDTGGGPGGGQGSPGAGIPWSRPAMGVFRERQEHELRPLIASLRELDRYADRSRAAWLKVRAAQPRYHAGPAAPGPGRGPRHPAGGDPDTPSLASLLAPGTLGSGIAGGVLRLAAGGFTGGSMSALSGAFSLPHRMAMGGLVSGAARMVRLPVPRSVSEGAAGSGNASTSGSGRGGITIAAMTINNPVAETAGESITRAVQRAAFLAGRGE